MPNFLNLCHWTICKINYMLIIWTNVEPGLLAVELDRPSNIDVDFDIP